MKKNLFLAFVLISLSLSAIDGYRYSINLTKIVNDKVNVTLTPPALLEKEIDFMFPAMVPGTYEVYNFGRFISNLKVKSKTSESIKITKERRPDLYKKACK